MQTFESRMKRLRRKVEEEYGLDCMLEAAVSLDVYLRARNIFDRWYKGWWFERAADLIDDGRS